MLSNKSIALGVFILMGIGGFIGLVMSLLQIDFGYKMSIRIAIIVLFSLFYIIFFLVLILFLKVYGNGEEHTKEIKTSKPNYKRNKNGRRN